jgi:hypothetical protein
MVERLTAFTTATERTIKRTIERSTERLDMADAAIGRLSLAASQLELERQGRSSLGTRSSSGVSSALPSELVDQRLATGGQKRLVECELEWQRNTDELRQARGEIKNLHRQVQKSAAVVEAVEARAAAEARLFSLY